MMKEAFLLCALALPVFNEKTNYALLKQLIENQFPEYWAVFIHEDEKVMSPGAEKTWLTVATGPGRGERLAIWMVRMAA